MAKYLNKNKEIEILDLTQLEELKAIYSRKQPIKFKCANCGNIEHLQFGIFWKRTELLCHNCLLKNKAKFYKQEIPLQSNDINKILKPISPTQKIKFTCINCKNIDIVQFKNYTSDICEHCKRSIAAKSTWQKDGYKQYHKQCVKDKIGFDCIFQDKKRMKNAWEQKYGIGISGSMQIPEIQKKQHETMLKLYGGYTLESKILRKKVDEKVLKLYGAKNIRNSKYYLELYEQFKDDLYKNLKRLYLFDSQFFDSSWEVAYYIWLKDNNINFIYHPKPGLTYFCKGKKHTYYPDFIVNGQIIEIKGDQFFDKFGNFLIVDELGKNKYKCMLENNVIIYRKQDILKYIKYVNEKYGKDYIKSFKQF